MLLFGGCTVTGAGAAAVDVPGLRAYGLFIGGRGMLDGAVVDVGAAGAVVLLLFIVWVLSVICCFVVC